MSYTRQKIFGGKKMLDLIIVIAAMAPFIFTSKSTPPAD
jgi:hypothetical protein